MAPRKVRDVKALLAELGFKKDDTAGDSHEFYSRYVPGVGQVSTHFSHGETELKERLIAAVAGQLRVTGSYLKAMLDGKKTCEDWVKQIQTNPAGPLARYVRRPKR